MKSKSFIFYVLGLAAILGLGWLFIQPPQAKLESAANELSSQEGIISSVNENSTDSKRYEAGIHSSVVSSSASGAPDSASGAPDERQLKPYNEQDYVSNEEKNAYEGYSNEALLELGNSGDIVALHVLADRAVWRHDHKSVESYLLKASEFGSVTAAMELSILYSEIRIPEVESSEEKLELATEALAWAAIYSMQSEYVSNTLFSNLADQVVQEVDVNEVKSRVEELADQIQSQRESLGVGLEIDVSKEGFDNTFQDHLIN